MNKYNQLAEIHNSGKPYIIYKSKKGFDLYTNFSKKIVLSNKKGSSGNNRRKKVWCKKNVFCEYKKSIKNQIKIVCQNAKNISANVEIMM